MSVLTVDNGRSLEKYIYEREKYTKRSVATLRGEKNTLMFYVLRQTHHSFVWRRHCINTPEQFYKVVSRNNNAQQQQQQRRDTVINIHNKHQCWKTLPKQ